MVPMEAMPGVWGGVSGSCGSLEDWPLFVCMFRWPSTLDASMETADTSCLPACTWVLATLPEMIDAQICEAF